MNRREFLDKAAVSVAASVVSRETLGQVGRIGPNEKINIGFVGCGTQGFRQLMPALENPDIRIVAVCDPNRSSDDYPEWSHHELNKKVREFLDDPEWAKDARGGLCGREVGQEIVNRFYGKEKKSGESSDCRAYADYREMFEKEKDLDAVYIMTPDHLHGVIAVQAMRLGKHAITHKPMANVLSEARLVRDTAKDTGVATHLFCASSKESTPLLCEWIWSGAIGPVREVHNWSTRPFWPQGMTEHPVEQPPVPEGLDWDLWLGPVPHRPYHPAYTHAVFRGWYDFGAGALGDMGHYSFYQIYRILKLSVPRSVEASRSQYWCIADCQWHKQKNLISYPRASTIHWEFPAREDMPPVSLHWYDGGLRPPIPKELEEDGEEMPEEGLLFIGDQGKIIAGFMGDNPRLIPKARMENFKQPPQTLPRPIDELEQWIGACKGGGESDASFEKAYNFSEAILLGTVALRCDKKLFWDADSMSFTNAPEAGQFLKREYRQGWEL